MRKRFDNNWKFLILTVVAVQVLCNIDSAGGGRTPFDAKEWLEETERIARTITDEEERINALKYMAAAYSDMKSFQKAKRLARELPPKEQNSLWHIISLAQVHAKDIEGALKTIEVIKDKKEYHKILKYIGRSCAKYNISQAIQIAEKIPQELRPAIYQRVVQQHMLNENIEKAKETLQYIFDGDVKNEASRWIQAGEIYNQRNLKAAAERKGARLDDLSSYLESIAQTQIEKGNVQQAQKIIVQLPTAEDRARGFISLAEYYMKNNQKRECEQTIEQALEEVEKINDPILKNITQAGDYLAIAALQVRAGDFEKAEKTIQQARQSGENENKRWQQLGTEGLFQTFRGNRAIYALMIQTGKIDEVIYIANQQDHPLSKEARYALVIYYAAEGEMDKLKELVTSAKTNKDKMNLYLAVTSSLSKESK